MFWAKRYYNKQTIYEQCGRLCPHINMLKYFELRIMLTQQENLCYQVNSGRPITFVNKLAATFQNLGFLLEILSILAQDYKRIHSIGFKTLRWCHMFDTGILGVILKCNIGNSEGRFWRFGGISTF